MPSTTGTTGLNSVGGKIREDFVFGFVTMEAVFQRKNAINYFSHFIHCMSRMPRRDWVYPLSNGWWNCMVAVADMNRVWRVARVFISHCRPEKMHRYLGKDTFHRVPN